MQTSVTGYREVQRSWCWAIGLAGPVLLGQVAALGSDHPELAPFLSLVELLALTFRVILILGLPPACYHYHDDH